MHPIDPFILIKNGEAQSGLVTEIFREMARITNYQGDTDVVSFVRALKLLSLPPTDSTSSKGIKLREHRAHLFMVRTEKRENLYKWVGPLFFDATVIYQRANDPRVWSSFSKLKRDKAFCIIQREVAESEVFSQQGIPFYGAQSQKEAINLLFKSESRFDCTTIAIMNTAQVLQSAGYDIEQLKPAFQLKTQSLYMAFSESTPDTLIKQWQNALDSLSSSGTRMKLIQKYVPIYTKQLEQKLIKEMP